MLLRSQNGWPASSDRSVVNIQTISVPVRSGTLKIPLRAEAAPALVAMLQWWDANIEPITLGSGLGTWGYNYRTIRGYSSTLSNHASGTAIDINAPKHPLGARGTVPTDRVAAIRAKAASLGLRWGGDYSSRPDEMHFEVMAAPPASVVSYSEAKAAGSSVAAEAASYTTALAVGAARESRKVAGDATLVLRRNWWVAAGTVAAAGLIVLLIARRRR